MTAQYVVALSQGPHSDLKHTCCVGARVGGRVGEEVVGAAVGARVGDRVGARVGGEVAGGGGQVIRSTKLPRDDEKPSITTK